LPRSTAGKQAFSQPGQHRLPAGCRKIRGTRALYRGADLSVPQRPQNDRGFSPRGDTKSRKRLCLAAPWNAIH